MSTSRTGHVTPSEIYAAGWLHAVAFSSNGEYLVSGGGLVRVWRVEDGEPVATMAVRRLVRSLAVSRNGRWIAAGTMSGNVVVWDAEAGHRREIIAVEEGGTVITGLDFSPDSTRLISASSNGTVTAFQDITTRERVLGPLRHDDRVIAAKYSPRGDQFATATHTSARVYDSNEGNLLADVQAEVTPWYHSCLHWFNNDLLLISENKIKQIDPFAQSTVSEWSVPSSNNFSCIALPQHGEFIAYSTDRTVTFWDRSTHAQLDLAQYARDIRSIAFSPDDRLLAVGTEDGKITFKNIRNILQPFCFSAPFFHITDTVLDLWKQDRFTEAEAALTGIIASSPTNHHALASRALVSTHLRRPDVAIVDAEHSIKIRPSVVGYISKSVALIDGGEKEEGCRVFDLAFSYCRPHYSEFLLLIRVVVLFMAGKHEEALSRVGNLIDTTHFNLICYMVRAYMYLLCGNLQMENNYYEAAIQSFKRARADVRCYLGSRLLAISLISGWKFDDLDITIHRHLCEALYSAVRINEGRETLLSMISNKELPMSMSMNEWVVDFMQRCLSTHEPNDDAPTNLDLSTVSLLLREWAEASLARTSWRDTLAAAIPFTFPRHTIYQVICERLETINRTMEASKCFCKMLEELEEQTNLHGEQLEWVLDFKHRCVRRLEAIGDEAIGAEQYDVAISHYSTALSLGPAITQNLFIKRSKAYICNDSWEDALKDANKVILIDPSSPWGHERKHAALHKAGDYENAINAFETMLSTISQSPDPDIHEHLRQYVNPAQTKAAIRAAIEDTICGSPFVLINTDSGRLLDRSGQVSSFELQPNFAGLVSSVTTHIDHARIKHEVTEYYRYATFSHKWEDNEPLFEEVVHIVVYDLEDTPTHNKLQTFCRIVRDAGFHWAWSDTCCINKSDHFVLQEALVSMFKWYQGSSLTIVLLRGVHPPSQRGDLIKSVWNTRGWTLQEYHASKVVRFYNEDWTLYMNLDIPNHKESLDIISEMEEATSVSARALMALRPGLDNIREKLRLASARQTTRIEDEAYSLLGIFSASLPIVYGEGNKALGRLLAQLLMNSGDTSILAWTGKSGDFNSCLPAEIAVFNEFPISHIPLAIEDLQMAMAVAGLRASSLDLAFVTKLYDRLNELPVLIFAGQRMKLPCIVFKLGPLSTTQNDSGKAFRAQTAVLGVVEIRTNEDLSQFSPLYLIHPWIDFLLDRQPLGNIAEAIPEADVVIDESRLPGFAGYPHTTSAAPQTRTSRLVARLGLSFSGWPATPPLRDTESLRPPSSLSETDKQMRALQLLVRLRQPFGALLLTPNLGGVAAYRRIAVESTIVVQVEELTPTVLGKVVNGVRVLDVL